MYKILPELAGFCRRCDKTFWCVFILVYSFNCRSLTKFER